ncbi:MAG: hypothetical protein IJC51_00815, partial [Eggerthellaceae bacterium]|nr:hypothetical protein [Eggerthellaceae bacterium]
MDEEWYCRSDGVKALLCGFGRKGATVAEVEEKRCLRERLGAFLRENAVLCIAAVAALVTCFIVP